MKKRISKLAVSTNWVASLSIMGGVVLSTASTAAWAQFVTTPAQKATAVRTAQAGVELSALSPNAPDVYTVKSGDTLWAISGMFLKSPWRWPELWGMNLQEIRNPHLIYPGQQLYLDKTSGRAVLRSRAGVGAPGDTIKLSPRVRSTKLADAAIPTLPPNLIEPFLAEPIVIDEATLLTAPRIVATQESRVLLSRGDRAYARSQLDGDLSTDKDASDKYRVFRNAKPLKDPNDGQILGYEAQYVGSAELVRGESVRGGKDKDGKDINEIVPATIDIVSAKEEMRVGDRLLPEPKRDFMTYTPRAPEQKVEGGRIVSVYGSAVVNAAQNQIVVINRGKLDGMETGHVLAILSDGERVLDRTNGGKEQIKLPDERNGLLMVFRTFDKVSYALILQITNSVRVGDRLINPK
jgi:nucleoid-associated protein YgaU